MAEEGERKVLDGERGLSIFGLVAAAIFGFTARPLTTIADPIALLITGALVVLVVLGFIGAMIKEPTNGEAKFFGIVMIMAAVALFATVGDAWLRQRQVNVICGKLQHVMLFEHRKRTDVPDIFRTLNCRMQG